MIRVSCFVLVMLSMISSPLALPAQTGPVISQGSVAGKKITLKDLLEKRLKARRPKEFAFIAKVVKLVDQKKLPLKMVKTTYLWAMKKPRRRPFQYFERAMKLRAAKLKINL